MRRLWALIALIVLGLPLLGQAPTRQYPTWSRGVSGDWLYVQETAADSIVGPGVPVQGRRFVLFEYWVTETASVVARCSVVTPQVSMDGVTWFSPSAGTMATVLDSLQTRDIVAEPRFVAIYGFDDLTSPAYGAIPYKYARVLVRLYGLHLRNVPTLNIRATVGD